MDLLMQGPVKICNIPLIERQVNCLMEVYLSLKNRISKGEMQAVEDYSEVRQKIKKRTQQLELFYCQNQSNQTVKYLYSSISLLKKMAQNVQKFNQINEYSYQTVWKRQVSKPKVSPVNQKKSGIKSVSPIIKSTKQNAISKQTQKQNNRFQSNIAQNKRRDISSKKIIQEYKTGHVKLNQKQNALKRSEESTDFEKTSHNYGIKAKKQVSRSRQNQKIICYNLNNQSEVIFNIKFTKQQFAQIMKAKHQAKIHS